MKDRRGLHKGCHQSFLEYVGSLLERFMKVFNMFSPNRSRKKKTSPTWSQRCGTAQYRDAVSKYRRCTQKLTFTRMQLICYVRVQCIAKKTQGFCICVEQQYIGLYIVFPLEAFYKHLLMSSSQTFVYSCIFRNSVSWIVLQNNRRNQSKLLVEKPFHWQSLQ